MSLSWFVCIQMVSSVAIKQQWIYLILIICLHTVKWFQVLLTLIILFTHSQMVPDIM